MVDYAKFLRETPYGVLATRFEDEVRTRMFQFLFAEGNKVYFCTSAKKPVYQQLKAHPVASFCVRDEGFKPVLSVSGKVHFSKDEELKRRALDEHPRIVGVHLDSESPDFALFCIEVEEVKTFSFAEGPRTYTL